MYQLQVNEVLNEGLLSICSGLVPMVREGIGEKVVTLPMKAFHQQVFRALNPDGEFKMDQVHAYAGIELLCLSIEVNQPEFDPSKLNPGYLAHQKANSYLASFLMNRYLNSLNEIGLSESLKTELATSAGDLILSQINRLQYNYNGHFNVANYLTDIDNRLGLVCELLVKEACFYNSKISSETVELLIQIVKQLANIYYLKVELELINDPDKFTQRIIAGNYPLALLFAKKEDPDFFNNFFSQRTKPTTEEFDQLRIKTLELGLKESQNIIDDIIRQVKLDISILAKDQIQANLNQLLNQII